MLWKKNGLIYAPRRNAAWNRTHAQVPTVDPINDSALRVYFASRDANNRSYTSYIDVETANPNHILYEHDEPILPLGKLGSFDDCGVMPSWIVTVDNRKYLYYIGWTVRTTVPFHNSIGLAISDDSGKTFHRFSDGPIFGPTYKEPYFTGTSCVIVEGGVWRNWYLSCTKWIVINGKPEPFYHLKYAESNDGVNWCREGKVAIDYKSSEEAGIAKASVLRDSNGVYKMWYSYRSGTKYRTNKAASYRIGYAESGDGFSWRRMDELAGIDVSEKGWDSEMIEYPHVLRVESKLYMFYNGNDFGRSGFGYATSPDPTTSESRNL